MSPTWSTPLYERVAELVRSESGLVFPEARVRDVEAAVRRAAARRGLAPSEQLIEWLRADETAREALVAELTIGETYFNRDPAQFDLLRRRILPQLLAERAPDRSVRVWSAGCASGEEPYSVAMLFDELDALHRADIIGSDIARARLEDAQRALYSRWSLRAVPDDLRARYFHERARYYELTPRLRRHVDFRYLNLAEDAFPSLSTGIWGMDVILCRNVLIYFDRPTVELVARRLLASLSETGWLVLGASDPAIAELVECDVVLTDAGLVYRRAGVVTEPDIRREPTVADAAAAPPEWEPVPEPERKDDDDIFLHLAAPAPQQPPAPRAAAASPDVSVDERITAAYSARDYHQVRALAESAHRAGDLGERGAVAWLRALANQGCLEDAARAAAELEERLGASAELLYVHAVVLLQTGGVDEAAALCRRALYLDRGMIVAHLALADALRRRGDADAARRSLRNAGVLLARMDADEHVPAADGETAGRLAEMTKTRLTLLGAAA